MTVRPAPSRAGLYGVDQRRPLYSRAPRLYFKTPAWAKHLARRAFAARQSDRRVLIAEYLGRLDTVPAADGAS